MMPRPTCLDPPLVPFACAQLKEFGDSTELYAEERQADLDSKALEMRKRQEAVPGLLNPHVRHDDMSDM